METVNDISKKMNHTEIIQNLKLGVEDLNSKFEGEDWGQIEIRLSEFENDVLKCLVSGIDSTPTTHPVIGETLYLSIRDKFEKEPFKLVKKLSEVEFDLSDTDSIEKDKKKKKEKKVILKKADLIRQQNAINSVNKSVDLILESFNENKMICNYGLYTNKVIEFRGITFAYMGWFILNSKSSVEYIKKSKIPEVYEVMCSMQRFINTCKNYSGQSRINAVNNEKVSPTLIADVNNWLNKLKEKYPFDGITIYNVAPKLLIHSQYDDAIPNRSIKMRPNQRQLMNTVSEHPEGFLLFYNAAIASGKTTLASVGIASHLDRLRKSGKMRSNMQLIFCCNLSSVRRQVARNCWNAGIKFAIGSYVKATDSYKLTNHWGTKDDDRIVIIASPDVTALLLAEDEKKIREDMEKSDKERRFYTGKYWLFLDEPTVGADIIGSKYIEANMKVMYYMPKWSILSSATMPVPEKISDIISFHRSRYPEVFVDTQITKEISIGCDAKTFQNDMVVPHIGCKTQKQLRNCIDRINEIPFLGRLYTHRVAEQLWKDMVDNKINDIPDIKEYFSNVDNLSADKVRQICIEMLTKLYEQTDTKIKIICSSKIIAEEQPVIKKEVKEDEDGFAFEGDDEDNSDKVLDHVEFSKFGTSEAAKYQNMNLITSIDPIFTAKECFKELLDLVHKSGIDINRLRNFISAYEKKLSDYHKTRDYLAKSLDVKDTDDMEQIRKILHFEEEANKRGCGKNDLPILEFPKEFQINTLSHWKKFGSHYEINPANLRNILDITNLPLSQFESEDWLVFLLFCGVGVYSPYQIKDQVYLREVLNLSEAGKLAFIVSDSSICYGTNYPINRVFITKEFAEVHSINTMFQLMGRAGRAGQSWKAEVYLDNSTAMKLIDFVQNPTDNSGELEALNMITTFNNLLKNTMAKEETERRNAEDEEKRLIEEALASKRKSEEAARMKRLLKEKEQFEKTNVQTKKVITVQEVVNPDNKKSYYDKPRTEWKPRTEGDYKPRTEWKPRTEGDYKPRTEWKPRTEGDYKPRTEWKPRTEGDYKPRTEWKPRTEGDYRPRTEWKPRTEGDYKPRTENSETPKSEDNQSGIKYVPPWKREEPPTENSDKQISFSTYKKSIPVTKSKEVEKDNKDDSLNKISWRK
jgi:hypothetical protein